MTERSELRDNNGTLLATYIDIGAAGLLDGAHDDAIQAMAMVSAKPRIFATPSRWPGVWLWQCSWANDPPCNFFEWATTLRALRVHLNGGAR
jgi:hypothetical protein